MVVKEISDMYLAPPRAVREGEAPTRGKGSRRNWIRIRRMEGLFYIHFYSEIMGTTCNTRPTVNFEISVKVRATLTLCSCISTDGGGADDRRLG